MLLPYAYKYLRNFIIKPTLTSKKNLLKSTTSQILFLRTLKAIYDRPSMEHYYPMQIGKWKKNKNVEEYTKNIQRW